MVGRDTMDVIEIKVSMQAYSKIQFKNTKQFVYCQLKFLQLKCQTKHTLGEKESDAGCAVLKITFKNALSFMSLILFMCLPPFFGELTYS